MTPGKSREDTTVVGPRPGAAVDVSVVIVSWNIAELIGECLRSLMAEASGLHLEIIVVDNASTDRTVDRVRHEFPAVRVIANDTNLGFARANNQAFRLAEGRFVLILNPDTRVLPGALTTLVAYLREHPDAGLVGPALVDIHGAFQATSARLLPTVGRIIASDVLRLPKLPLVGRWFERKLVSPYEPDVPHEVQAISGAAMMIRREILARDGGFGDCFIHCGEDLDLCFRIRRAGWKILFLPEAQVIHLSGRSARQAPVRTGVNGAISIQCYFDRCFGKWHGRLYRLAVQVLDAPATVLIGLFKSIFGLQRWTEWRQQLQYARGIWSWRPM